MHRRRSDIDARDRGGRRQGRLRRARRHCSSGTATSSSPRPRASCSPTSARSRRTSAGSTATCASGSRPGTAPRASCWTTSSATAATIADSDQGRSFQAFYDLLLSPARQRELTELLERVHRLDLVEHGDARLRYIHHDWLDAGERTQATVRQLSEQLRRFLDDQVWLENRRVMELLRSIESRSLALRDRAGRRVHPRDRRHRTDHTAADGAAAVLPGRAVPSVDSASVEQGRSTAHPRCCSSRRMWTRRR